ncbi:MAG: anaerobic ribonucleoside-triphosphate reductase activating protein, partial [Rubrivivax sp.]|nr:anaerobic ribonucleoside-triphosphate reductase activating protein [Rubrivivax sp.]
MGGLTPFTSIDYPGLLSAVVFVQGCPWRCGYCHNPHLQARDPPSGPRWSEVLDFLRQRAGLLDAVVFSGGEPTLDPALPQAIGQVRTLGFKVGLHSAGVYPQRLQAVLPLVDWVGLDIKAPLASDAGHERVTGVRGSAAAVRRSLAALVQHGRARGLPFECRTTAHPALLDDAALLAVADDVAAAGVAHWVLQIARAQGSTGTLTPVGADYPAPDTLRQLRARLPAMAVRRG